MIQICFMKLGLRQSPQCRATSLVAPAAILKFLNIKLWVQVVNLNPRGDILVPSAAIGLMIVPRWRGTKGGGMA
ncbi:MAG: hypothetical protein BROFUL_01790 [Candidatus Brocadia fulgida]|uniref:Uncharacterized protein n=1 Tax=Candidatus Brocadia fulgida TaxID=380242 RepID=A0A0M2UYD7_9BACT|nr:MAG: hypothetical protein BROFUL_01790 [Candidatus Brocadia fulgida]